MQYKFVLILFALALSGCGANANDIHAETIPGPNGVTCYAIVQNGEARGGNCL